MKIKFIIKEIKRTEEIREYDDNECNWDDEDELLETIREDWLDWGWDNGFGEALDYEVIDETKV